MLSLQQAIEIKESIVSYLKATFTFRKREVAKAFHDFVTKNLLNANNEEVRLTTFHGIKGLEFKHVFIVDVNQRTLPLLPYNYQRLPDYEKEEIEKREKALFYVASNRAIQRLIITGTGNRSKLVKL